MSVKSLIPSVKEVIKRSSTFQILLLLPPFSLQFSGISQLLTSKI
uniref:Nectin cell adhesion molecule 3 n=1 Tax=Myotis myotis TaxID=51298 RepID=A0A7J8A0J7_MYOMY|nr:nectin cell adhesion molecule 3 [Myotis myotis]